VIGYPTSLLKNRQKKGRRTGPRSISIQSIYITDW
jgi:hypothetical protein